MKLSITQKQHRTFGLLLGMLEPTILPKLEARGFTPEVHEEGFRLLRATVTTRLAPPPPDTHFAELLRLQRTWLPVVRATLGAHHPELLARLPVYRRNGRGTLILGMHALLEHLVPLRDSAQPNERAAAALLAARGVGDETLAAIDAALRAVKSLPISDPSTPAVPDRAEAERAMWRFYLEWSAIVRSLDVTRGQRRQLGFLTGRRRPRVQAA